ncbi:hypothetical protein WMF38_04170 [Sorangium sp. So ce118]
MTRSLSSPGGRIRTAEPLCGMRLAAFLADEGNRSNQNIDFKESVMKILSPRVHGYIDYAVAALFLLAPSLFGFSGLPETLCYILGAVHVAMTLLTAYPLGAAKVIPFPVHGGLEAAVAVFLVAAPWLFNFDEAAAARNFFLVSGVAVGLVWLITDYRSAYATTAAGVRPEHRSFS